MTARNLEVDRIVRIGGAPLRIRRSVGSTSVQVKRRVETIIDKLVEMGQLDIVKAFAAEKLDASDLLHMDRSGPLATLADIRLNKPLFQSATAAIKGLRKNKTTLRYATSLKKLKTVAKRELTSHSLLRDMEGCDWAQLHRNWKSSPSDWMHLRRMVSRVLTLTLESEHHPFRLQVMAKIPTMKENQRTPRMTPDEFEKAVRHVRADVQDTIIALVVTGVRLGEFLRLKPSHLDKSTCSVFVPGTKTGGSKRGLEINPQLFRYVERAVFRMRLGGSGLRKQWKLACDRADVEYVTLHDLRHLHAQWAVDMGVPDSRVQDSLGHSNSAMTRRYSRKAGTSEVSDALARVLLKQPSKPSKKSAGKNAGTR